MLSAIQQPIRRLEPVPRTRVLALIRSAPVALGPSYDPRALQLEVETAATGSIRHFILREGWISFISLSKANPIWNSLWDKHTKISQFFLAF
ncbi:hypothetical protein PILCRDRAFT_673613 [Piloderma croceum F 1598]|uniref:Uncharacterized protein n=1 Tax=Piloderma croceum (strain F 1598) TaxID=765440 RepID=A0A0C3BDX9_PILCF|nr:hypothetical protein PILCRDRAFT_673613 [Piloderma croceum F 1598]